jgi:hypothetical protein
MKRTRFVATGMAVLLGATLAVVPANAAKKKKPKPYKSDPQTLVLAHTMLQATSGEQNNVTLQEFENQCSFPPVTNGLDAVVWEVPKEYQTIQSNIETFTTASQIWDHYFVMYNDACEAQFTAGAAGAAGQTSAVGVMVPGIKYVAIANFAGEPADVWWEAKPQ